MHTNQRLKLPTQAYALTGNRPHDVLLCGRMPHQLSNTSEGMILLLHWGKKENDFQKFCSLSTFFKISVKSIDNLCKNRCVFFFLARSELDFCIKAFLYLIAVYYILFTYTLSQQRLPQLFHTKCFFFKVLKCVFIEMFLVHL